MTQPTTPQRPDERPAPGYRWSWYCDGRLYDDPSDAPTGRWLQTRSAETLRWLTGRR